jgi:hypothetical protein
LETPSKSPPRRYRKEQYYALRALGRSDLPARVTTQNGLTFVHVRTFKHDFFAATGLYREETKVRSQESEGYDLSPVTRHSSLVTASNGNSLTQNSEFRIQNSIPSRLAVLKMGRTQDFLGVPMDWLARYLTRHEAQAYQLLAGQPGVPALLGVLPDETGFLHEYVPGRPLQKGDRPTTEFFAELSALLATIHSQNMAYVDLHKRQNVLLGDDGRPYLIDFQISFLGAKRWPLANGFKNWLLRVFQDGDRYHLAKHKYRLRPDLCNPAEVELATQGTGWTRLHRKITRPLQGFRRRTLERIRKAAGEEKGSG